MRTCNDKNYSNKMFLICSDIRIDMIIFFLLPFREMFDADRQAWQIKFSESIGKLCCYFWEFQWEMPIDFCSTLLHN